MDTLAQLSNDELVALTQQQQALLHQQAEVILFLQQQVAALQKEIETLKRGGKGTPLSKPPPPDGVKPNTAPAQTAEAQARKKRPNAFTRPRQRPTEEIVHTCSHCPDCGRTLAGGSEYSRRQIIELPPITVRVIDHIQEIGLRDAEDAAIFHAAKSAGAVVMTKDADFLLLLDRFGVPPQIIWLTCGNTSNARLKEILTVHLTEALRLLEAGEPLIEISDF